MLLSTAFQMLLFAIRKFLARNKTTNYLVNLRNTLVEGITNVYGMVIIIATSTCCSAYMIHHTLSIGELEVDEEEELPALVASRSAKPGLLILLIISALPFFTRHALRFVNKNAFIIRSVYFVL